MAKAQKFNHEPREWENGGRVQKYCLADGQLWPCDHAKRNLKALTDSEGKPKVATSGN